MSLIDASYINLESHINLDINFLNTLYLSDNLYYVKYII